MLKGKGSEPPSPEPVGYSVGNKEIKKYVCCLLKGTADVIFRHLLLK